MVIVGSMAMPSGLPVSVAAFVGRERERAKVAELVADARVVTLTGTGGCGKARLAVDVARDESVGEWLLGMVARGQEHHDDARAHLEASRALSTDPRLPEVAPLPWTVGG